MGGGGWFEVTLVLALVLGLVHTFNPAHARCIINSVICKSYILVDTSNREREVVRKWDMRASRTGDLMLLGTRGKENTICNCEESIDENEKVALVNTALKKKVFMRKLCLS